MQKAAFNLNRPREEEEGLDAFAPEQPSHAQPQESAFPGPPPVKNRAVAPTEWIADVRFRAPEDAYRGPRSTGRQRVAYEAGSRWMRLGGIAAVMVAVVSAAVVAMLLFRQSATPIPPIVTRDASSESQTLARVDPARPPSTASAVPEPALPPPSVVPGPSLPVESQRPAGAPGSAARLASERPAAGTPASPPAIAPRPATAPRPGAATRSTQRTVSATPRVAASRPIVAAGPPPSSSVPPPASRTATTSPTPRASAVPTLPAPSAEQRVAVTPSVPSLSPVAVAPAAVATPPTSNAPVQTPSPASTAASAAPSTAVSAPTVQGGSGPAAVAVAQVAAPPPAAGPRPAAPAAIATPAAATPAPTAAAAPANPILRPSTLEAETTAIQTALGRYRRAFNALDAGAAQAVWPSVNERTLSRAFDRLEEQDVSFENCSIDVRGVLAEAACSGTARYVPRVGNRTAQVETRRWRFNLRKGPSDWLIEGVDAR